MVTSTLILIRKPHIHSTMLLMKPTHFHVTVSLYHYSLTAFRISAVVTLILYHGCYCTPGECALKTLVSLLALSNHLSHISG